MKVQPQKVVIRTIVLRGTPEAVDEVLSLSQVPNKDDKRPGASVEISCTARQDILLEVPAE